MRARRTQAQIGAALGATVDAEAHCLRHERRIRGQRFMPADNQEPICTHLLCQP
jgi:hypothetical protein